LFLNRSLNPSTIDGLTMFVIGGLVHPQSKGLPYRACHIYIYIYMYYCVYCVYCLYCVYCFLSMACHIVSLSPNVSARGGGRLERREHTLEQRLGLGHEELIHLYVTFTAAGSGDASTRWSSGWGCCTRSLRRRSLRRRRLLPAAAREMKHRYFVLKSRHAACDRKRVA